MKFGPDIKKARKYKMPIAAGEVEQPPRRGRPPIDQDERAKQAEQNKLRNRPIDKNSEEIASKRLLPTPPGKKITWDEMMAWLQPLTPEMWNHLSIYMYRDHPRILRKLKDPDAPKYIDLLTGPFDMDYMVRTHGGGRYSLMACDTDARVGSKDNRLFECDFDISMSKAEPKLNYEELDINAKQNMAYVQLLQYKGLIDSKGQVMPAAAAQPNPAGPNPEIIKQVLDFLAMQERNRQEAANRSNNPAEQSITKSIGEILVEKVRQDDPAKLAGLIKEFSAINKPPDNVTGTVEKMMAMQMEMQREQHATSITMMDKVLDAKQNTPNPQMDTMNQMLEFAARINGMVNRNGGGGERNGWDIGLDYARELGVPLFQTISNLINLRNGAPMTPIARPPAAGPQPGAAFDPYANPAMMRTLAQNAAAAAANPAQQQPMQPAAAGAPSDLNSLVQVYGGLIVSHLNSGTPGWEFADYVTRLLGMAPHAQIAAQGEGPLLNALMAFRETAQFGQGHLQKFVHEFIHFQEFLEQEQPGDEEEEEPAGPERVPVGANPVATGATP